MRHAATLLLLAGLATAQGARDPWSRLERFDENGDGKVSKKEFRGPERLFGRLDSNGDGFVTREEAGRMRRGRGGGETAARFDGDGDGAVSRAEWEALFEKADENGDGVLQSAELQGLLSGRPARDGAPAEGSKAPAATAHEVAAGKKVDLLGGGKPTVLVFGSWT